MASASAEEGLPATTQQIKPDLEHALDVRIDVKGAYIVEGQANGTPNKELGEYLEEYQQDSRDIRLPHQRSVVSHMAVDVSFCIHLLQELLMHTMLRRNHRLAALSSKYVTGPSRNPHRMLADV
jgi:hypothetical protein